MQTVDPQDLPGTASRRHRPLVVVVLSVLVTAVVTTGALTAGPAAAHTDLVAATPGAGDQVALAPDQVVLVFTEEVSPRASQVVVRAPDGTSVQDTVTVSADTVTVPVLATGPGEYEVLYRVTSADGHPVLGRYSYEVTGAGSASPEGPGAAGDDRQTAPTTTASAPPGPWLVSGVVLAAVVLVLHRRRPDMAAQRPAARDAGSRAAGHLL